MRLIKFGGYKQKLSIPQTIVALDFFMPMTILHYKYLDITQI